MIELILSRHGETLENQQHILQGQLPGTLSPLGKAQAENLAEILKDERLDAVVSSDLARSYETALAVAKRHGLTPHQTPLLREMDWGVYTGQRLDDVDWLNLPPSVESVEALYQRATDFIRYLQDNFPDRRIIAIGHGAFNRAIITYLEGKKAIEMIDLPIMENTTRVYFKI
ncbi:histidine phosphatase family protein [Butyricimonas synergistica]|uniref:histidine phosphatase family protein n=1 Tax=Butyricimonas synergistica TaxID=544644 RepID=UPI00037B583C|nr:histidine phosphatase family protein [Butyricimonas synergistica]